jgi:putative membrane protein
VRAADYAERMKLLTWLVVNTLALGVATWLFDGITLDGSSNTDKVVALLVVGAIFGVVTSFIRPIVNLLSLPLIILTLGLMLLVVNALMLMLTSWIAEQLDLGFHVDGFWTALFGSIVISIASLVLESLFPQPRR